MSVVFTQEGIFYKYYFEQPIVDEFIHKYFATVHFEQYCESMYNLHVIYNNPLKNHRVNAWKPRIPLVICNIRNIVTPGVSRNFSEIIYGLPFYHRLGNDGSVVATRCSVYVCVPSTKFVYCSHFMEMTYLSFHKPVVLKQKVDAVSSMTDLRILSKSKTEITTVRIRTIRDFQ